MFAGVVFAGAIYELPTVAVWSAHKIMSDTSAYASSDVLVIADTSITQRAIGQIVSMFDLQERPEPPSTSAYSYIVGDVETGEIIAQLNADQPLPIASVTKLFTAETANTVYSTGAIVSVSKEALNTYGSSGGFVYGERFLVSDVLYPLLLESSNDAAEILAEGYGRSDFMLAMNELAQSLDLSNTTFDDPSGLSPKNISSAEDLFKYAQHLYKYKPELLDVTHLKNSEIERTSANSYHFWRNRNSFISENDELYIGGKIGYIPEAAQTMLAFFNIKDGALSDHTYAIAVLRSGARNRDVALLMNYATNGLYGVKSSAAPKLLESRARDIGEPADTTSLLFVGDIMLDRGVASVVNKKGGDFDTVFEYADFLSRADITFGNLEGPASDRGYDLQNLYSFRMNPTVVETLREAGFDILSLANNHVGDWGRPAFEDTLTRLTDNSIEYAGAGFNKEHATEARVIEHNGLRVGYLAFTDVGPQWLSTPDNSSLVLLASDPHRDRIIADAAEEVDVLVVSYHFGNEYESTPSERQRQLAESAIDNGARIVVGHHPHVVQPVERYKDGLIAYSLGNFVFDQDFSNETMAGLVLEVVLEEKDIVRVTPREIILNKEYQPQLQELISTIK